jgi:hypothetical protein
MFVDVVVEEVENGMVENGGHLLLTHQHQQHHRETHQPSHLIKKILVYFAHLNLFKKLEEYDV